MCTDRDRYGVVTSDNVMRTKNGGHLRLRLEKSIPPSMPPPRQRVTPPVTRSKRYAAKAKVFRAQVMMVRERCEEKAEASEA